MHIQVQLQFSIGRPVQKPISEQHQNIIQVVQNITDLTMATLKALLKRYSDYLHKDGQSFLFLKLIIPSQHAICNRRYAINVSKNVGRLTKSIPIETRSTNQTEKNQT